MRIIKNEQGFTLIEMLIVMLVISILLIITVPNIAKNQETIEDKGCAAYTKMVEGQVQAYKLKTGHNPASVADLITEGLLNDEENKCPTGKVVEIDSQGNVILKDEQK